MTDPETISLRKTVIAGKRWPEDFTVIWRGMPVGRIMLAPGMPPHVPQWQWTCNIYSKPGWRQRIGRRPRDASAIPGRMGGAAGEAEAMRPSRTRCGGDSGARPRLGYAASKTGAVPGHGLDTAPCPNLFLSRFYKGPGDKCWARSDIARCETQGAVLRLPARRCCCAWQHTPPEKGG